MAKKKKSNPSKNEKDRTGSAISLCMMVKNEEECLGRCLESVYRFVDEIIIIDTGSTDRTVEIAESYGAKIHYHTWENDFSKHRNQSISYATGDWIFQLDADEELFIEDGPLLREIAVRKDVDYCNCRFHDMEKDGLVHGIYYLIRLYRNGLGMSYERKVHNQLVVKGNGIFAPVRIRHYGYDLSKKKMEEKHLRTTMLLEEMLKDDPDDVYSRHQLALSYAMHREFDKSVKHGDIALETRHRRMLRNEYFITTFYVVAQGYFNLGNLDEAEGICLEALEFFPYHLDACHILAAVYFKTHRLDLCLAISERYLKIRQEIEKNPSIIGNSYCHSYSKREDIYFGLACIYYLRNEYDKADHFFEKSFTYSDKKIFKARNIAQFYLSQKMEQRAVEWLKRLLEIPIGLDELSDVIRDCHYLYLKMCSSLLRDQDLELALQCLERAEDKYLNSNHKLEKEILSVKLSWFRGDLDRLVSSMEDVIVCLRVHTLKAVDSLEDLGQIMYDVATELCARKIWDLAESTLELAVQIAPERYNHHVFEQFLQTTDGVLNSDSSK